MDATRADALELIGREAEVTRLEGLLEGEAARGAIVDGPPGIGKTRLWEMGIALAQRSGWRVLAARAAADEMGLGYVGLADLLEGIDIDDAPTISPPQRNALGAALLRNEHDEPIDVRTVAAGLLNVLRWLASSVPVLVAVDDLPWLDEASLAALAFAGRRLGDARVRFLLTSRDPGPNRLISALEHDGLERIHLGPMSLGASQRLLFARLGLILSRRDLLRLHQAAGGSPLFVLELGRAIAQSGRVHIGEEMPLSATLDEVLGRRVAGLPHGVRRAVLAAALSGSVGSAELATIVGAEAVDEAHELGVLTLADGVAWPAHPLLGGAAKRAATAQDVRELHLALARVADTEDRRARHLALATDEPSDEIAAYVSAAATRAARRGATDAAVELAHHALRLSRPRTEAFVERLLDLSEDLLVAGELHWLRDVLSSQVASLPAGSARVRARLLLSDAAPDFAGTVTQLEQALADAGDDRALRAMVLARLAIAVAVGGVERLAEAERWLKEVTPQPDLAFSERAPSPLFALAWLGLLRGRPIDDIVGRLGLATGRPGHIYYSADRLLGIRAAWRGEHETARSTFARLLELADERGESESYAAVRLQLCELAVRAGDWPEAERYLDEWAAADEEALEAQPAFLRLQALLAAGRGQPAEAERLAQAAGRAAEQSGVRWQQLEATRALGLAVLFQGDAARSASLLGAVWQHTTDAGVDDPGAFPVAPDLVEALLSLNRRTEAAAVTSRLERLARDQRHPWALAATARSRGLLDSDATRLLAAATDYESLGLRFDAARTLVTLGRVERRARHWGPARDAFEQAARAFATLGSPGWVETVRSELARVGGRRPQRDLSPTEAEIAALVGRGLSNKEIAAAMFLSEKTVEANLTRIFRKRGVHSRAELALSLAGGG